MPEPRGRGKSGIRQGDRKSRIGQVLDAFPGNERGKAGGKLHLKWVRSAICAPVKQKLQVKRG